MNRKGRLNVLMNRKLMIVLIRVNVVILMMM